MSREEPHIVASLIDLCRKLDIKCVVQVGAQDGFEAAEIAHAIACRAVAIEADSRCSDHKVSGVEYHVALIGADDCDAEKFYRHESHGLSSKIPRGVNGEELLAMPQRRLDTFCRELDIIPDALIIDTEGTCMDVLLGATGVLGGIKLVYAEVQTREDRKGVSLLPAVDAWMAERGFVKRDGHPAYSVEAQGNFTYVRPA